MLTDLKLVIRLQSLDDRAAVVAKEVAVLPKQIAEIEKKLELHRRRLEVNKAALTANQMGRKKAEGDIQSQQQKISKFRGQMADAKTNDQYRAFQNEIEFCENEIRHAEDSILELMSQAEPLDRNLKESEKAFEVERKQVEAEKAKATAMTAEDRKHLETIQRDREEVAKQIARPVLSEYERIRKGRAGVAVAEVVNGRCSKCNMAVRLQFLQELKQANKIMKCESCSRILYLNPPADFSDLAVSGSTAGQA